MSSALRQKRGNTIVFAILALVILGLGGYGAQNFSGRTDSIGAVGEEKIDASDYFRALQSRMRSTSAQFGTQVTIEIAQQLGLDAQIRAQLFSGAALDGEARRIGVSAGDEQVRRSILGLSQFSGPDGGFDREAYRFALQQEGLTEAEFEARLRKDAVRAMIERAVADGAPVSDTYVDALASYLGEERDFVLAELLGGDLPEPVAAPDEAAVKAFHDANPDLFTRAEVRDISYIWLTPEMAAPAVEVSEADLRAAYAAREAEFLIPERREVARLVFPTAEEAAAAKARIDGGRATFDDEVTARGLSPADVALGDVGKDELGAAGGAIFALAAPGIVGPVDSDLGPALYSMSKVLAAEETTFEEARPDLEAEARLDRARRTIADRMPAIEDLLASGATIEDVAEETGLEFGKVSYAAESADGIAGYSAFRAAAEAATAEEFPALGELDDGGIFAIRLDGIDPPALKPLEEVRDQVVAAWTDEATHKALLALAETIRAEIDTGATLAGKGLVTTSYAGFARNGHIDGAPAEVAAAVFRTAAGKASVTDAEGRVFLVQVTETHAADPADAEQVRMSQAIGQEAGASLSQDLFSLFAGALELRDGVSLDQAAIAAVHSQIR